jgi:hypothetical protein
VRLEGDISLKNPVTPPGIDPGTFRLVTQRLNHYATPRKEISTKLVMIMMMMLIMIIMKMIKVKYHAKMLKQTTVSVQIHCLLVRNVT